MSENREWQVRDVAWAEDRTWERVEPDAWYDVMCEQIRTDAEISGANATLIATTDGPVDLCAALDRARDTAALLESELAAAVVPQVLTAETPEPPRPWRVVPTWDVDQDWTSEGAAHVQTWAQAVSTAAGRPAFVISARAGDDRG